MKSQILAASTALVLVMGCASPDTKPQAFEYKRSTIEQTRFEATLTDMSSQGWEVVDHTGHQGSHVTVLWKRPRR